MILKEINRRIIAIITLCLFVLSTSGMVLFYHYCQHANQMVISVYIDSTQELCQENAATLHQSLHHNHDCCHQNPEEKGCCKNHDSNLKTVQLKNTYNFSDRQSAPKPTRLSLLQVETPFQIDVICNSLNQSGLSRELPPEIPLKKLSGKEILTLHHTFKIAC